MTVIIGDNEASAIRDIETSLNHQIPVIVLQGSKLSNEISDSISKNGLPTVEEKDVQRSSYTVGAPKEHVLERLYKCGKVVSCKNDSEDIAALIHLFLTVAV